MKMKKTLALILALIMMLSVALVACGDKPEETEAPNDDFFNDVTNPDANEDTAEEGDETGAGNSGTVIGTSFVTKNDTVYVVYPAAIRESAKTTSTKLETVKFGTALQRIEANNKWSKVKLGEIEGYIANDLITTNEKAVKFETLETPVTSKITNLGSSSNANLRKYPLYLTNPKVVDAIAFDAACIIGQVAKDAEVTIISVSADGQWAYIKCVATTRAEDGKFTGEKVELEGYCIISALNYTVGGEGGSDDFFG